MCKNAEATAANLMLALEPDLINLETATGLINNPLVEDANAAYKAALAALQAWVPGTAAQDTIQVINAFTAAFDLIPFPPEVELLENTISAAIVIIITTISGNSPAPVAAASAEVHQKAVASDAQTKLAALLPGFKEGVITRSKAALGDTHAVAGAYQSEWKKNVAVVVKANPKYATSNLA